MGDTASTKNAETKAPAQGERSPKATELGPASLDQVAVLQGAIGNRALSQFVASAVQTSRAPSSVVQRKCECGNTCSKCKNEEEPVQAKSSVAVSQPGDQYEREADSLADRVMLHLGGAHQATNAPSLLRTSGPILARSVEPESEQEPAAHPSLPSGFMSSQSSGYPLPDAIKNRMEGALGYDFSGVRVHSDGRASEVARGIRSEAFTYGRDIFFREGRYRPHALSGQRLLAHELAHVIQQGGAHASLTQGKAAPAGRVQRFTTQRQAQRQACLADITRAGMRFPCKGPPSPKEIGSKIHKAIQKRFRKEPNQLTELPVPGAATVCREAGIVDLPSTGSADLVKVRARLAAA